MSNRYRACGTKSLPCCVQAHSRRIRFTSTTTVRRPPGTATGLLGVAVACRAGQKRLPDQPRTLVQPARRGKACGIDGPRLFDARGAGRSPSCRSRAALASPHRQGPGHSSRLHHGEREVAPRKVSDFDPWSVDQVHTFRGEQHIAAAMPKRSESATCCNGPQGFSGCPLVTARQCGSIAARRAQGVDRPDGYVRVLTQVSLG